jgi:thymidylate synthase (FAD)
MVKVYLLAMTRLEDGFADFLNDLNITSWVEPEASDGDLLVETAGRLCYKSWAPYEPGNSKELNANVTKIREGNGSYVKNLLTSKHTSTLEHVNFTFLLRGCSRVLTHELVRHRAGMAYSQESLRYCRLEHLEIVLPPVASEHAEELIYDSVDHTRQTITQLNKMLLDDGTVTDFYTKKQLTSLIRRIAPIGVKTNIMFTANARALRHIIALRTSKHAEVEIREVFLEVASVCKEKCPNIFATVFMVGDKVTSKYVRKGIIVEVLEGNTYRVFSLGDHLVFKCTEEELTLLED